MPGQFNGERGLVTECNQQLALLRTDRLLVPEAQADTADRALAEDQRQNEHAHESALHLEVISARPDQLRVLFLFHIEIERLALRAQFRVEAGAAAGHAPRKIR